MSVALVCAGLSALCWVGLDVSRKQLVTSLDRAAILAWLSVASLPLYVGWWLASPQTSVDLAVWWPPGLGVLACNVVAGVLFLQALAIANFSATIPFLCLGPACTIGAAWLWLGETPSLLQLVGIVAVTIGAIVLIWDARIATSQAEGGEQGPSSHLRGALWMTVVAALWSMSATLDKLALRGMSPPLHAVVEIGGVGVCMTLIVLAGRRIEHAVPDRKGAAWIAIGALTGAAALSLQLIAIQSMFVGAVDTLKRAVGVVAALVIGGLIYKELVTLRKVVAALLMAAGAAIILWP